MRPTDDLKAEHRRIEEMLEVLERACERLSAGIAIDPDHLDQMLEFLRTFADQCHHGKEEELLFPAMGEAGISIEDGPIAPFIEEHEVGREYVRSMGWAVTRYKGELLEEHALGRGYVKGLHEAAAGYRAGDPQAAAQFVENARDYIALLTDHIQREDQMLFPIADAHLSDEQQAELEIRFEAVVHEKIGTRTHQALHESLDRLRRLYVSA